MDCSLPDSFVHGISQARILEWVAIFFFRESSPLRDYTCISFTAGGFLTTEQPGKPHLFSSGNVLLDKTLGVWGKKFSLQSILHWAPYTSFTFNNPPYSCEGGIIKIHKAPDTYLIVNFYFLFS